MRALPWCGIAAMAACNYSPEVGASDAAADGPLVGAACGWTFSPRHVGDPCTQPFNDPMTLTAGTWTYNTETGVLRDPGGIASSPASTRIAGTPAVRVLGTTKLVIDPNAELIVSGTAAFGFVVDTDATIDGTIDVSGSLIGNAITAGPGGNAGSCLDRTGAGGENASNTDGGGGGGGGGFGTAGGAGSRGAGPTAAMTGGEGGVASSTDFALAGGCGGGVGGMSDGTKGEAGAGGGILLLVVKGAAAVRTGAELRSAGSGAKAGRDNSGGSGGGSGGMIAIQTATLALSGQICANGGGGAGGSGDSSLGGVGESGQCSTSDAANGGNGINNGEGGDGGVGTTPPQAGLVDLTDNDGGGGGGGSVGRVFLRAASLTNTGSHSPEPLVLPFDGF